MSVKRLNFSAKWPRRGVRAASESWPLWLLARTRRWHPELSGALCRIARQFDGA